MFILFLFLVLFFSVLEVFLLFLVVVGVGGRKGVVAVVDGME
jgi:hypothetical protein